MGSLESVWTRTPAAMGVFRLSSFIRERYGDGEKEVLPRGTLVLIDGSGWVHHLFEGARFDLGGDYLSLDDASSARSRSCARPGS